MIMTKPLNGHPDNVIKLWTRNGPCQVELLSGDISSLSPEEGVDIVMVSAFSGDYSPMSGTLIGSLKCQLGISVAALANHKELDLRHLFSCWVSKPITTQGSPFKKLICFERKRGCQTVPAQIRQMFRAFVPVFNNQDHTVITPLLATGHQTQNNAVVLASILEGAVEWINAGLPLRKMKIVVYNEISEVEQRVFTQCKLKYLKQNENMKKRMFLKKFDIYIIFNPKDQEYLKDVQQMLKEKKSDIKIYAKHQTFSEDKVWEDEIFQRLIECKRIITLLSPAFMENESCLELYNMAICCNRLMGVNILVPFYIETIDKLPSYMGLVQWIECRVRKEGETWEKLNQTACSVVVKAIIDSDLDKATKSEMTKTVTGDGDKEDKYMYDVFISYSHKNPEHAEKLLQKFNAIDSSLRVFYDRSALTTGSNWQNMIYESVGECKCLIALVSATYLSSIVCMEEYNLALARYLSKDKDMLLIPVCIEKLTNIPAYMSTVKSIDAVGNFDESATELSNAVVGWLKGEQENSLSSYILHTAVDIEGLLSAQRCNDVRAQYRPNKEEKITVKRINPLIVPENKIEQVDESVVDIALSYTSDSTHLAGTFFNILDGIYPNLNVSVHSTSDQSRFTALDTAKKIVVFVSREFLKNEHHMQELHLAVNRQRPSKKNILYLVQTTKLDGRPFFPRILQYDVACKDSIWTDFESTFPKKKTRQKKVLYGKTVRLEHSRQFICHYYEYFAMMKAVEDVLESLLSEKDEKDSLVPMLLNVRTIDATMIKTAQNNSTSQNQSESVNGASDDKEKCGKADNNILKQAKADEDTSKQTKAEDDTSKQTDNQKESKKSSSCTVL